ncbi:MAG: preprotein translocase subunit YajC [Acidobacteriota bacterium]
MSPHLLLVAQAQANDLTATLLSLAPPLLIFLIFYVIWFLPLRKRQKQLEATLDGLKKGDRVVTNGGLLGKVVKADGPTLVVELADNVRIRIRRGAIAGLEEDDDAQAG